MNVLTVVLAASMLLNGGFEEGAKDCWNIPDKCWGVEEGVGRDATKAMVWNNDDPGTYCFAGQYFQPEPFIRYRFSAWVKVEKEGDGKKVVPQVGVECVSDAKKWLFGDYAMPVLDNDPNTQGWVRYEGVTRPMPENVAKGKLIMSVPKGCTGRVKFDEFTLEAMPEIPLVHLQCSAYRDAFCDDDGALRFVAMLRLNTFRSALENWKCELEFKNSKGKMDIRQMAIAGADRAELSVDAADFAVGRQPVIVRLFDSGAIVSEMTLKVEKTAERAPRKIWIDSSGRVVKDGKRFFPLGLYANWPTEETISHWKGSPFNFAVQYGGAKKEHLDLWESAGVSVCPDVRGLVFGYRYSRLNSKYTTLEETKKAFEEKYSFCTNHPAFFGWYLVDEAPAYMIPNVTSVNRFLREFDSDHPTYIVTDKVRDVREYMPTFDAVGVDAYPIGNRNGTFDKCADWSASCIEQVYGMRPLWFVPQMFNWAWYRKDDVGKYPDVRMPTREEMANMTWQGIAAGANGICGYSFGNLYKDLKGEEFNRVWGEVCSIGREVKSVEHVLLADDADHGLEEVPATLVARGYRYDGKDVLLVVSRRREPVKETLKLKKGFGSAKALIGGGAELKDGNRLEIDFPACGYAMVVFE